MMSVQLSVSDKQNSCQSTVTETGIFGNYSPHYKTVLLPEYSKEKQWFVYIFNVLQFLGHKTLCAVHV